LLSAILGEVPQLAGRIELLGSVAYCAQIPWLLHGTVQDNITFGKRYDEEKFSKVVDVCSLRPDLALLQDGQATIIGERGVNLSGGQKARVSLARAAYSDASLYLLDDPLSAVDAHVAVHLVKECLGADGFLSKTTRLLVSHQVQFATEVDLVVVIRNGE
ncbi:Abcc2, partial [Symbiodinium sp. KB8]